VGNGGPGGAAGEGAAGEGAAGEGAAGEGAAGEGAAGEGAGAGAEGERDGGGGSEWEGEGEGEGEGHSHDSPTPREKLLQAQVEALISRGNSRQREGGGAPSHDDGHFPAPQTWPGVQGGPVASLMRAPLEPVKVRLRRAEEVRE
jgi:hypothetical protein